MGNHAGGDASLRSKGGSPVNPASVLVVDDDAIIQKDLVTTLGAMDYHPVYAAGNGDDAVKLAREFQPDVVLMDIMIPGSVDGLGAAKMIHEELGIPVIFVTAYADD